MTKQKPKKITVNGKTRTISEWAKILGVSAHVIHGRLRKLKWSPERAVTTLKIKRELTVRQKARAAGEKYYEGKIHYKCGYNARYTSCASCVYCRGY